MPQDPPHAPAEAPALFPRPAVFLDRDDTLNQNTGLPADAFPGCPGDLFRPAFVRLLPGVREACRALRRGGYALVVVTNQACVALGNARIRDVEATNERLRELLGPGAIDAVYAATHHDSQAVLPHLAGPHPWRKPGPGMLLAAAREIGLDLGRSWMIGDTLRDKQAGIAAGLPPDHCLQIGPEKDAPDLPAAAQLILDHAADALTPNAADRRTTAGHATTVTLRARTGEHPLRDRAVRDTVIATARAIAERTGVHLIQLVTTESTLTATIPGRRIVAIGFMAELRRLTNAWYAGRGADQPLWSRAGDERD